MFHFARENQDHGESIYNLVEKSEREKRRVYYPGQYISRYACKVRKDACCRKNGAYKTMGTPSVFLNQPHNYLKKFSGAEPCFWKNHEDSEPQNPKSCLVNNNKTCKCCCNVNTIIHDSTPKAKPSQSERSHNYSRHISNFNSMAKTRGSHSQPFLLPRNVSCQTENTSSNGIDCNPNYTKNLDGNGDEIHVIEEDDCLKFGDEINCTCTCGGGGADGDNRQERIPISYNGSLSFIDRGQKDFIRDNALAVMRSPPKIPERRIVDEPNGHTNQWAPKKLLGKVGFGKVPSYIHRVKQEIYQRDFEMKDAMEKSASNKCRILTEEERGMIVKGLQFHWKEIFSDFQRLPLYSLSPKLEKRKVELETNLKSVENDLQLFNRNGPLYVADVVKSHYL